MSVVAVLKNKLTRSPLLFLLLLTLVYLVISWIVNDGDFSRTNLAYYNYLVSALLHKRLFVTPFLSTVDLSWFNGKWFIYWGPAPILFISPFYVFARTNTSDVLYTVSAGLANIYLFYFLLRKADSVFALKKKTASIYFILTNFALISPHLYLSIQGRIWHTNQVVAITYLLLFLIFYLKYYEKPKNYKLLLTSIFFLNLAVLSRYTLIFYFILLIPLLIKVYNTFSRKYLVKTVVIILSTTFLFLGLLLTYNHLRFGNIFETGVRYVNIRSSEDRFIEEHEKEALISLKYFKHNFDIYFLNHVKFSTEKPYVIIDKEGNSIPSVYPLFLLFPLLFLKKYLLNKKYKNFLLASIFGVILPLFTYFVLYLATGWAQFGIRYFLDIMPLLFLLFLFVVDSIPPKLQSAIVFYGIPVNILGSISFYFS